MLHQERDLINVSITSRFLLFIRSTMILSNTLPAFLPSLVSPELPSATQSFHFLQQIGCAFGLLFIVLLTQEPRAWMFLQTEHSITLMLAINYPLPLGFPFRIKPNILLVRLVGHWGCTSTTSLGRTWVISTSCISFCLEIVAEEKTFLETC